MKRMEGDKEWNEANHLGNQATKDKWWLSPLEPRFKIRPRVNTLIITKLPNAHKGFSQIQS